jgi:hypothetical protein
MAPWGDPRNPCSPHDPRDRVAEPRSDLLELCPPALILRRIVQQRGNGLVLAAAIVEHDGGHTHQVAEVRSARSLARLTVVDLSRVAACAVESRRELCHRRVQG